MRQSRVHSDSQREFQDRHLKHGLITPTTMAMEGINVVRNGMLK
jgi:hypothetical protein